MDGLRVAPLASLDVLTLLSDSMLSDPLAVRVSYASVVAQAFKSNVSSYHRSASTAHRISAVGAKQKAHTSRGDCQAADGRPRDDVNAVYDAPLDRTDPRWINEKSHSWQKIGRAYKYQ